MHVCQEEKKKTLQCFEAILPGVMFSTNKLHNKDLLYEGVYIWQLQPRDDLWSHHLLVTLKVILGPVQLL